MKNKAVSFLNLGEKDFLDTWKLQTKLFDEIIAIKISNKNEGKKIPTPNYLIFVEHPHVFTMGKSKNKEHLLDSEDYLSQEGIGVHVINRGGDITYHGPGQLVCYPIFDLENFFTDIHRYLRLLEEAVILTLFEYGLKGERIDGKSGIWLGVGTPNERKICAVGVRASRWVTMHGFAFNINPNLSYFRRIIPCGLAQSRVTSLELEIGKTVTVEEVKEKVRGYLSNIFGLKVEHAR